MPMILGFFKFEPGKVDATVDIDNDANKYYENASDKAESEKEEEENPEVKPKYGAS